MGPFTKISDPKGVVEGRSDGSAMEAIAKITGKYSGLAPAITGDDRNIGNRRFHQFMVSCRKTSATTSSGEAPVPCSIFLTRAAVGRMTGRPSVQPFS